MKDQFSSIEHLSAEAVAAFVDNEMPPRARHRARVHLVHCQECRRDVMAQRDAAMRMREAAGKDIHTPSSLMDRLSSIPDECPLEDTVDKESMKETVRDVAFATYRGLETAAAKVTDAIGERAFAVSRAWQDYRHDVNSTKDIQKLNKPRG